MVAQAIICFSERDVDSDFCPGVDGTQQKLPTNMSVCRYSNEVSNCTATGLLPSDSRAFMAGTYIWSGFDYDVDGHSSGASATATGMLADRVGFLKPLAWWFRAWWLSNISAADAGRPVLWPSAAARPFTCHIVESWVAPPAGNSTRSIHVYSNAAAVQLHLNGKAVGGPADIEFFGMADFPSVGYAAGNLTAEALDASGERMATHSVFTPDGLAGIALTLDAPSPLTGTGSKLVADGQDVAMVRASLVDSTGRPISPQDPKASTNITFRVVSGGGRLLGLHNGDPSDVPDGLGSTFPGVELPQPTTRYATRWLTRCRLQHTTGLFARSSCRASTGREICTPGSSCSASILTRERARARRRSPRRIVTLMPRAMARCRPSWWKRRRRACRRPTFRYRSPQTSTCCPWPSRARSPPPPRCGWQGELESGAHRAMMCRMVCYENSVF